MSAYSAAAKIFLPIRVGQEEGSRRSGSDHPSSIHFPSRGGGLIPIVVAVAVGLVPSIASAHRLDEYLQAAMFSVDRDHISFSLSLTPGTQVFGQVLAAIDANRDGAISEGEQRTYIEHVERDLTVSLDGRQLPLRRRSFMFPTLDEMREGIGDIAIYFEVDVPPGGGSRRLSFENRHLPAISVYLVNCLVPLDPVVRIVAQDRNFKQSTYELDYTLSQDGGNNLPGATNSTLVTSQRNGSGSGSLFKAFFYQGVHHILTGYDHLLFVAALVLAATTLWDLIKVVTAFTLAHTMTMTLAALNVVHVPGSIVEPCIAGSIVFVALQNLLWPSRAQGWSRLAAAFFFGLFHGLGFAGGLLDAMREMQTGAMLLAIVAFSLGLEAGHQLVVLPLFALLKVARRTRPTRRPRPACRPHLSASARPALPWPARITSA